MQKTIFLISLFLTISLQVLFSNTNDKAYVHYQNFEYSKEEIKLLDYDTVYLVGASPTNESVGSLGAHAFIVLAHGEEVETALAINFYAYHERMSIIEKVARGATSGLVGYIDIRPFSNIAERYTIGQNRSLFVYKTNIDKSKIPAIIDEFYKYKESDLRYQFFNYNCSSLLGNVFATVLSTEEKEYKFPNLIMPGRLIYLFDQSGLLIDEKIISPPLIKDLVNGSSSLSKSEIIARSEYFKIHGTESSIEDGFSPFIPTFNNFKTFTIFNEKVSKLYLGMDTLDLSLGLSLFDNQLYEQRQSSVLLYDFKVLDAKFKINSNISIEKFTLLESSRYTKINIAPFKFSTYFSLNLNPINNSFDIITGYGIAVGGIHSLLTIIPTFETNTSNLLITLILKSNLLIYTDNAFLLLDVFYPFYNKTSLINESIEVKAGYSINDTFSVEASYDFLKSSYDVYLKYSFYPLML